MGHHDDAREEQAAQHFREQAERAGITVEQYLLERQEAIFQFFRYSHLPEHLQAVSQMFHHAAQRIIRELPRNSERTVALRKLLEAKDAAVRARLHVEHR